jgi:drug/metabolite transporter (DMT)-like permease
MIKATAIPARAATNPVMGRAEWFLLALLSVLWGGSFFFVGVIVRELPPFTLVLIRGTLAALALIAVVLSSGATLPRSPALWGAFLVMAVVNSLIPYSLIAWGQQHIDSGLASILISSTPLFSVVLAHLLTREEHLTASRIGGVVVGLTGVIVLIGPSALRGLDRPGLGQLAVLGAAVSYACAGIYGRRFKDLPPVVAAAGQLGCTVLLVAPLALLLERPWTARPSPSACAALVGLGLLSTALGYFIFCRILAVAGATNVMLVNFLNPVSALLLGMLVLQERPPGIVFAGMAGIFAGLVMIDGRLLRRARPAPAPTRPASSVD